MTEEKKEKKKFGKHIRQVTKRGLASGLSCGEKCLHGLKRLSKKWFTHVFLLTILFGYAALGGLIFSLIEGSQETEPPEVKPYNFTEVRGHLIELLLNASKSSRWPIIAQYEIQQHEIKVRETYDREKAPPKRNWDFFSAMFFCGTVFTTIGYGHISPKTPTGRIATIVYASIGIPLTLIVLVDIGKLFTRAIKFLFKFVRRFYYTGSCKRVRASRHVEAVTKALHSAHAHAITARDKAMSQLKDRSPSSDKLSDIEEGKKRKESHEHVVRKLSPALSEDWSTPQDSPTLPVRSRKNVIGPENTTKDDATNQSNPDSEDVDKPPPFSVDDEFNLPVSLALLLLSSYILLGAFLFTMWEKWNLFEAFYFIFISISTIGFGDYVPEHPMFMMAAFIYLLFGLALTSMCINVTQEALTSTLQDAKKKIGAKIGIDVPNADDLQDPGAVNKPIVELAGVHRLQTEHQPTPPPRQRRKKSAMTDDDEDDQESNA